MGGDNDGWSAESSFSDQPRWREVVFEARDLENPRPATPESVEYGELLFSSQCVMCHGADGSGTGHLVVVQKDLLL